MAQNSNANVKKTLAELLAELGSVRSQVAGIEEKVVEALNERWVSFDSVLFASLKDWCVQWNLDVLVTYSYGTGQFQLEPKLCLNPPLGLVQNFGLKVGTANLDAQLGEGMSSMLLLASAGLELQWDDEKGLAVLPFCLIERPVGYFLLKGTPSQGLFDPKKYERVCQSAENMLTKMRRDILAGHFENSRHLSSRVS